MPIRSKPFVPDIRDVFAPFFVSLATIGIRLMLRDYERISRVLRTGGHWDLERLRFTLIALLVRNSDQEIDFRHRFDSFFQESQAEAGLETIDLNRVLEELQQLADRDAIQREYKPVQILTEKRLIAAVQLAARRLITAVQLTARRLIPEPSQQDYNESALPPAVVEERHEVDEEPSVSDQTAESTPPPVEDYSRFPFGFAVCNGEVTGETFELPDAEALVWNENGSLVICVAGYRLYALDN